MLAVRGLIRTSARNLVHFTGKNVTVTGVKCLPHFASLERPHLDVGITRNRNHQIMELPIIPNKIIENPKPILNEIDEIISRITDLRLPTIEKEEIQAARLIVIRRKKMKKHKLKKLRKRMRFAFAKLRQRREMRKEKAFEVELRAQIKEAEQFSAEAYVAEKLGRLNANPLPRYWKGKRLPEFLIKELMAEEEIKKQKNLARIERLEKYRNWKL